MFHTTGSSPSMTKLMSETPNRMRRNDFLELSTKSLSVVMTGSGMASTKRMTL